MDLAERISTLRRVNGLSARQLAALVDVAPTTVTRIESGAVSPSFGLAQEILTVLGEPIGFTGVADVDAIATARLALDPKLAVPSSPGVELWRQRWARIGLLDADGRVAGGKEADLMLRAGRAARLTRRPGAVDFVAGPSAEQVAVALDAAAIDYALTGDAGANRYRSSAGEAWPVLYVEDVARAAEAAGLVRKEPGAFGMRVTLIPFDGVSEVGRVDIGDVSVVARDQVVIDAYGGIDRMLEQADILTGEARGVTDFKEPRTEIEWSRRAIINVVGVLQVHAESLTLVGAHAVLLRTMDLDVPRMPTGDGDLGVTPGLVGDVPSIEALLADAGYEHRTTARPGLWGRGPYEGVDGARSYREKIDLLAPHGLSGTASRSKRGVPALQPAHGKLAVGNALGLELATFNRSLVEIGDFADPRLTAAIHVAEIPALILAKGSKIGERLREPRKGPVRDKDLGDLWRLMAVADPAETAEVIEEFADHTEVGGDVRQSVEWTAEVLRDPVSIERAKLAFDTFVDPAEVDRVFALWRGSFV